MCYQERLGLVFLGMHTIGWACPTPEFLRCMHLSLSLFQVCMRLTLPCLHVCHSICMRTPWEGAIGMGERVGSYCGCTCSQSGIDGRGTSGKSGVKKLRRRALREKLNFLRRKPKRSGGSTSFTCFVRCVGVFTVAILYYVTSTSNPWY